MANLVAETMKMASPTITDKIATSFGLSGDTVRSVLTAAVPGIMGAVVSKASSPSGISDILSSLRNADPTLTTGMTSALSGANTSTLASEGTSMLNSVLGSGTMSTLTNAVVGSSGVSSAAGASVLGLAGQMVMGTLAKHSAGLDASGLGNLLSSQAGYISQAMPAAMGSMMGSESSSASAASRVKNTVTAPDMPSSVGGMGWLKYAIPAALIALAIWYFMGNREREATEANNATTEVAKPAETATTSAVTPATTGIMIDNVDVTKNLTVALSDLTGSLGGITDATSATAALPKLQSAVSAIGAVSGVAAKFTPEQKTTVAALVNSSLPVVTAAATKIEAMPGVGDIVKPVLDSLLPMLTNLSK
jgi:Bacterial protein of unknown function (DUF937)